MKTIKEIADIIGVSKQAVYKRVKGKLYPLLQPYIHTVDGTLYIDETGQNIIKNDFEYVQAASSGVLMDIPTDTPPDIPEYTVYENEKTTNFLQKQIEFLNKELEKEREHNRELNNKMMEQSNKILQLAEQITSITKNSQVLLGREQEKNYIGEHAAEGDPEPCAEPQKKRFWSKLFKV